MRQFTDPGSSNAPARTPTHGSDAMRAQLQWLTEENTNLTDEAAYLRGELDSRRSDGGRSGTRRITGRTMTALVWVFALTLGALFWQWNTNERSYHAGFGAGYAEAFGVRRDGAGGSSAVSSAVATPPTTPGDAAASPMPEIGQGPPTKTMEYKNGVLTTTTTWPVPGFSPPPPPRGAARH